MMVSWTRATTILNILVAQVMFFVRLISRLNPLHVFSKSNPIQKQPAFETKPSDPPILNILYLPDDIILLILHRVGSYHVLMNVKRVCKLWYALSKDSYMWRVVDVRRSLLLPDVKKHLHMSTFSGRDRDYYQAVGTFLERIALCAVDLSNGHLLDLCIQDFGSDVFLISASQRATQLRRLTIIDRDPSVLRGCTIQGLINMLQNLPLLEDLQLHFTPITGAGIEVAGGSCDHLRAFTLNSRIFTNHSTYLQDRNEHAIAIAKSMPGLCHLRVIGNAMTSIGLVSILDSCHYLEILDLRDCYNLHYALDEEPNLQVRLEQQIKQVRFPSENYEDDDGLDYY